MAETATKRDADLLLLLRKVGLIGTVFLLPFENGRILGELDGLAPGYNRLVYVSLFDLALILLLFGAAIGFVDRFRRNVLLGTVTASAVAAFGMLALVFHPSSRGFMVVVRLVAVVVLVVEMLDLDREQFRRRVAIPLMAAASLQAVVALAQAVTAGPIGLAAFGERSELLTFGGSVGAAGTMLHPYVLAGFSVLAATVGIATLPNDDRRPWWLAGIGMSAIPIGVTYSRGLLLGLVVVFAALIAAIIRGRKDLRAAVAVLAVAIILPAAVFNDGWLTRIEESSTADGNQLSSNRILHVEQSLWLIEDSPVVGVGPGLYTYTLERDHQPEVPDSVHAVPFLIAAESGVVAGLVFTVLLALIAIRAFRTSAVAVAVGGGLGIFLLLDKFTYLHPNGMVMFAIWLAMLDRLWRDRDPA